MRHGSAILPGDRFELPAFLSQRASRRSMPVMPRAAVAPNAGYAIASTHRFKAVKDLVLNRNFYGGFSLRCKPLPGPWTTTWSFVDGAGRLLEQKPLADGKPAPFPETDATWVAYVEAPSGITRGIALFNHPGNPEEPFKWCVIPHMPFLSPSATGKGDIPLAAGGELALRYGIAVFNRIDPVKQLSARFEKSLATDHASGTAPENRPR
jgi:hypothetical protein